MTEGEGSAFTFPAFSNFEFSCWMEGVIFYLHPHSTSTLSEGLQRPGGAWNVGQSSTFSFIRRLDKEQPAGEGHREVWGLVLLWDGLLGCQARGRRLGLG